MLLWVWCRLAATAPIWPLTWELPYAVDVALKKKQNKKNTKLILKKSFTGGSFLWCNGLSIQHYWLLWQSWFLPWHKFDLWPRNFHMLWMRPKNKKRNKKSSLAHSQIPALSFICGCFGVTAEFHNYQSYSPQSLKYLLPGPLDKVFKPRCTPCYKFYKYK